MQRYSTRPTAEASRAPAIMRSRLSKLGDDGQERIVLELRKHYPVMLVDQAPSGGAWLHEIKFDGYHTAARVIGGKVTLMTWRGLDWTEWFQAIPMSCAC